jgi:two-component system, NarL family, sensor kinase
MEAMVSKDETKSRKGKRASSREPAPAKGFGADRRTIAFQDGGAAREATDARKQFSMQLADARERERRLIAQDLHDTIGGRLAGLQYGMERVVRKFHSDPEEAADSLRKLLQVVQATIEETRRIARNLHPSVLDDLGLKAALRDLVREFKVIYPTIAIDCTLSIDDDRLSDHLKIQIYRVCQEALTNVGKHSHGSQATLRLQRHGSQIVLEVTDNGIGMLLGQSPADRPESSRPLGLLNMRERTDLAGGRLEIHSQKGQGVRILADWPAL